MSAGFTPGPWKRSRKSGAPYIISEADGQTVARVTEFVKEYVAEQVANANLIAGAPELCNALERLWQVVDSAGIHNLANGVQLGQTSWAVKCTDAMAAAASALIKARGEQ